MSNVANKIDEEDPFSCFGEDEDDEEEEICDAPIKRDEISCGILSFHPQTESSLLNYIENKYSCKKADQPPAAREYLLKLIDDYCYQRHWMMHIGPEKRKILESTLQAAIQSFVSNPSSDCNQFTAVELGTYCGYSAIAMGLCLEQAQLDYPDKIFKLYSFDVDSHYSSIAKQLIQMTQLENSITTVLLKEDEEASNYSSLQSKSNVSTTVHFLFLDHDKSKYKHDIISFENAGLLKKDSIVMADNVLFAGIDDYKHYVQSLETNGKVDLNTISTTIEYCNEGNVYEDTIEIMKYLS